MANNIAQKPLYNILPVGQQIIFTIENSSIVNNYWNVKFLAELHVSRLPINLSSSSDVIGTFKTTPNNAGVGIFDFQSLLEGYVGPQNRGGESGVGSKYKGVSVYDQPHPIHLIDQYARNIEGLYYFAIQYKVEGSSTQDGPVSIISGQTINSESYLFFNGVLQKENYLTRGRINATGTLVQGANYGFDLDANLFYLGSTTANSKFLTNAPTTQYANINDYGTFAFFNQMPTQADRMKQIYFYYYNSAGVFLGSDILYNDNARGGVGPTSSAFAPTKYLFVGAFPGNLQNTSTTFKTLVAAGTIQGGYYTVTAQQNSVPQQQQTYTINLNCPTAKGYESIRLTWLNQWGAWDYYTFTMKSVRSTTTNRTTYTQMGGTWNNSVYEIEGYKGGKKNFRVNSTERIQINSDFLTEADAVWFEELMNSQSVYILNGYNATESNFTITNKYVEPVLITTSSYTRKTVANDKLIQYTFELERNKTQKTQPA
jgi:hypothetical protein